MRQMRHWLDQLKNWARITQRDAVALYLAARDPRVQWYAKAMAVLIAAYALSPIDLIPDFIPILGYLDELILLPLAIAGVVRLIDPEIMTEHRARASQMAERPTSKLGAALIVVLWSLAIALVAWWLLARW
jgi:uncharacterized membrane protein YkvA (DUF1232 family)